MSDATAIVTALLKHLDSKGNVKSMSIDWVVVDVETILPKIEVIFFDDSEWEEE